MKIITLILLTFTLTYSPEIKAQSGWQVDHYYNERGGSDVICSSCYAVFVGYDIYNRPIYNYFQNCQQREWHSWYGNRGGYFWTCNGYNCSWNYQYEERTWWYFTWRNFTRPC